MRVHLLVALATAALASYACSGDSNGTGSGAGGPGAGGANVGGGGVGAGMGMCFAGLESLALSPADSTVQLTGAAVPPITFDVTGTFADGTSAPIPSDKLTWEATRADDTNPGSVMAGVFAPFEEAGGVVTISATDGCASGSATVNLFLDVTLGQPDDPGAWNGMPQTGASSPAIVYPSDETRFPRNLYRTIFQWYSEDLTSFRLTFEGPNSKVVVYTDGVHGLCGNANPAAGCWEVNELAWSYIAASNAGATATWFVDSLDTSTDPPSVWRGASNTIGFSQQDVEGAIFYWSTTSAGIRRGRISQVDPEDYIVGKPQGTMYGTDEVGCVACHTVSRDGKYMVAPVKSAETGSLWVMEVTKDAPPTPLVTDVPDTGGHGFGTISPDNAHVVVSFKEDYMWMVDRETGAFQGQLPTDDPMFDGGTQPDWSPDDTQLVFATGQGDGPGDASLALVPWDGSSWGQPSILLAPPNGESNLFPMFSPTGEWIAFAQGKGGHGDETAQLWAIRASGGAPVEMTSANRMTNNELTDGQYQNSQPTWAPPGDYDWVAFNTKRPYGVILDEGTQQIWIAAIDLDKATQGGDPSYPAFRVPFQGLEENNHRAFWTLDVNDGGGGQGGMGGGGGTGGAGGLPCLDILNIGEACDPLQDCCESGAYCDSLDGGATYECVNAIAN
jgi:hypothetical protein